MTMLRFSEILISRICHDVIAPLGAVSTGLELFQDIAPSKSVESEEIFDLIANSALSATTRITFFRAAFGGGALSPQDIRALLEKYFSESKMALKWEGTLPKEAPFKEWGRLLLTAALCLSDCAPRGGEITIEAPKKKELLALRLKADSIRLHPGWLEALTGEIEEESLNARTIPCYAIHRLVQEIGAACEVEHLTSSSELTVKIKKRA